MFYFTTYFNYGSLYSIQMVNKGNVFRNLQTRKCEERTFIPCYCKNYMIKQIGGLHIAIGISVQDTLAKTGIETQPGPSTVEPQELPYVATNERKHMNSKNGSEKAMTRETICFYCLWKGNLENGKNVPCVAVRPMKLMTGPIISTRISLKPGTPVVVVVVMHTIRARMWRIDLETFKEVQLSEEEHIMTWKNPKLYPKLIMKMDASRLTTSQVTILKKLSYP